MFCVREGHVCYLSLFQGRYFTAKVPDRHLILFRLRIIRAGTYYCPKIAGHYRCLQCSWWDQSEKVLRIRV